MTAKERVKVELLKLRGNEYNAKVLAAKIGIAPDTFYRYRKELEESGDLKDVEDAPVCAEGIKTVSMADFIDNYQLDSFKVIREGIDRIPEGQIAEYDTFRRDLGLPEDRFKEAIKSEEFKENQAVLRKNKKIIIGQPDTIATLKQLDGVMP
jgi:hypothetical protein